VIGIHDDWMCLLLDHATTTKHFVSRLSGGQAPATVQLVPGAKHFMDTPQHYPAILVALRSMIGLSSLPPPPTAPMRISSMNVQPLPVISSSLSSGESKAPIQQVPPAAAAAATVPVAPIDPWAPQPCPYTPMYVLYFAHPLHQILC
jgi:hypothetical protein